MNIIPKGTECFVILWVRTPGTHPNDNFLLIPEIKKTTRDIDPEDKTLFEVSDPSSMRRLREGGWNSRFVNQFPIPREGVTFVMRQAKIPGTDDYPENCYFLLLAEETKIW